MDRCRWLGETSNVYDSALILVEELNEEYPDRSDVLTLLGTIYRYNGAQGDLTKKTLIRAVTVNPGDVWSDRFVRLVLCFCLKIDVI